MEMKDLFGKTDDELRSIEMCMAERGNLRALGLISDVRKYYGKTVKVVKGRKVPLGTTGTCFWLGCYDNSRYGDPWGIYTTVRAGIKDDHGTVYWTSVDNVEVI